MKDNPGRFKPGQSGNPNGRAPGSIVNDLKKLAKSKTHLAVTTLEKICKESKDDRAKFMAAKELLDRGWGRVKEHQSAPAQSMFLEMLKQLNEIKANGQAHAITGIAEEADATIIDAVAHPVERIGLRDGHAGGEAGAMAEVSAGDDFDA